MGINRIYRNSSSVGFAGYGSTTATLVGTMSSGDFLARHSSGKVISGYGLDPQNIPETVNTNGLFFEVTAYEDRLLFLQTVNNNREVKVLLMDHSWNVITTVTMASEGGL